MGAVEIVVVALVALGLTPVLAAVTWALQAGRKSDRRLPTPTAPTIAAVVEADTTARRLEAHSAETDEITLDAQAASDVRADANVAYLRDRR